MTGRKRLVALYHVKNVVRQEIVTTPRHILDAAGECHGNYFAIFTEDFTRVNGKGD
ncbi:MAG: hypothetical protein MR517_08585 [Bacteroidales bacterium]|nr:hypothetical protein [Bacteroidales bacterium]